MRVTDYLKLADRLDENASYSRTTASAALGVNANGFNRLVKSNSLWLAFGEEPNREGRRTVYSGKALVEHLKRLANPRYGVELAYDYYNLDEDGWRAKYDRPREVVFGPETYLEQLGGWRSRL